MENIYIMQGNSKDKKWLVKNNNQIIGPFSEEELQLELAKDYISPFATVCVPGQPFWGFISAYPEFVVHTDVTKLTQFTKTLNINFTKTHRLISDHIFSESSQNEISNTTQNNIPPPPKQEKSVVLKRTNKKKAHTDWVIFFLIVVGVFSLIIYQKNKSSQAMRGETAPLSEQAHLGADYFSAGDYFKAFEIWQDQQTQLNPSHSLAFRILKFQLKNDISEGKELVNINNPEIINQEIQNLIKALVQLKIDKQKSASKLFKEILARQPSPDIEQSAFANLALLAVRNKECDFFKQYKESQFANKNIISFAFSFCLLESDPKSLEGRKKAQALLEGVVQNQGDYYQEALVGLAYIKYLKKEDPSAWLKSLLDSNPYLTDTYRHNVFIDRKIYSWSEFVPFCKKIYSTGKENVIFITFYAYCLSRSDRYEQAEQFIKKVALSKPRDPLIKAQQAYIMSAQGSKGESVLLLGTAVRFNTERKYTLPYILQARFCEKNKDWACAVQNWQIVLEKNPLSVSGLGGLSYAKYNQGLYEEAEEYMTRGFSADQTDLYSPLLFVQSQLEKIEN